jgi:hypothetical protein
LIALKSIAREIESELAKRDRQTMAEVCEAEKLLDRCGAPALVMYDRTVVVARYMGLSQGDAVDLPDTVTAGATWLRQLGHVLLEPLPRENCWLVRLASHGDTPAMRVSLDLSDPENMFVRVRGTIVEWDIRVTRPQHARVLGSLYRNRDGLTAAALSGELHDGERTHEDNIRGLICELREKIWWLIDSKPYRFGEQLTIELR